MQNLHLYLLGILVFASAAVATVTTPLLLLNASHGAGTVAQRPIIGIPDPRFHLTVHFEGSRFPLISCLMNTVEFLYTIGSEDFSGKMGKVSWKTDNYPEVGMVVSPSTRSGTIERRLVIWGLSQGVAHMIRLNRFQTVVFTISCAYLLRMFFHHPDVDPCPNGELRMLTAKCVGDSRKVGTIMLVAWPSGRNIHLTQDVTQQPKLSFVNSSSDIQVFSEKRNITSENTQDPKLEVQITLTEKYLPLLDVFLLVISVLVDAAAMKPRKRLRSYTSQAVSAGSGTPVRIVFEDATPARTGSLYFEVQWLMMTMALIPNYMIRKGAFQEAVIVVELDGLRVANGQIGFYWEGPMELV